MCRALPLPTLPRSAVLLNNCSVLLQPNFHTIGRHWFPRTKGATDLAPRTRPKETPAQKLAKAAKKAKTTPPPTGCSTLEHAFSAMARGPAPSASSPTHAAQAARHGESAAAAPPTAEPAVEPEGSGRDNEDHEDIFEDAQEPMPGLSEDIEADLDEDDDDGDNGDDENSSDNEDAPAHSVMGEYLKAVYSRLHSETTGEASRNALEDKWLLRLLNTGDWWIRAEAHAQSICTKLGLSHDDPSYYRDIKVWIPDLQYGAEAKPPCVECKKTDRVGVHCYAGTGHCARRICSLTGHYFVMTRRYICHECEAETKALKEKAKAAATEAGLEVLEDTTPPPQYTYRAWDSRSLPYLPFDYGAEFPAFLTRRGGVDMLLIDLMRPLFDKGVRPEALSKTMLELHAKAYTRAYLRREHDLARDRRLRPNLPKETFSDFADKSKYAGRVPTGNYLSTV